MKCGPEVEPQTCRYWHQGKRAHGAEIMFLSTNVDIATLSLAKGVHRRVLNVNVDIGDSNVDVGIEVGVVAELTSA